MSDSKALARLVCTLWVASLAACGPDASVASEAPLLVSSPESLDADEACGTASEEAACAEHGGAGLGCYEHAAYCCFPTDDDESLCVRDPSTIADGECLGNACEPTAAPATRDNTSQQRAIGVGGTGGTTTPPVSSPCRWEWVCTTPPWGEPEDCIYKRVYVCPITP